MAVTRKADVLNHIPQIWADDLYSQAENLTFWHNFEGGLGTAMPIQRRDDLTKDPGDTIKFDIVLALTGAGLTGDTSGSLLEGNEEALKFRQTSVAVDSLQHAVRYTWLSDLLQQHNTRTVALNQLTKWLSGELDRRIYNEFTGGSGATVIPDKNLFAAGSAVSRATVADTNAGGRPTLNSITELKAYAQVDLKIEPIRVDNGQEYFGLVMHPYAAMQLKRDDTAWAQAQRDAQIRGDNNPLFTGAVGLWDGVIIYTSNRVPRSTNGTIMVADNIFFGANAMCRAYAAYPDWVEELFSYGQEIGIGVKLATGQKLNVFDLTAGGGATAANMTAIGSVVFYTSAIAPAQP